MEDRGIDEVYIDFTDVPGGQREGGRVLARLLQKHSRRHRPDLLGRRGAQQAAGQDGQRVQQAQRHQHRARGRPANADLALPCRKINGIGPNDARLQEHGIHTIGELAARQAPG
jgi:DNA polymerase-4